MNLKKVALGTTAALVVLCAVAGYVVFHGSNHGSDDSGASAQELDHASDESMFVWNENDDTAIVGLSDKGRNQKELIFPETCTSIDGDVFQESDTIERVVFLNPDTTFSANFMGWINCENLQEIVFPDHMTSIPSFICANCCNLTGVTFPSELVTVEESAFSNCSSLRSVVLPDTTETIGYCAFENCTYLSSIDLGSGLKEIEARAFYNCYSLYKLSLPESMEYIGSMAFTESLISENNLVIPSGTQVEEDAFADEDSALTEEEIEEIEELLNALAEEEGEDK